jgi:hypothetical protein
MMYIQSYEVFIFLISKNNLDYELLFYKFTCKK